MHRDFRPQLDGGDGPSTRAWGVIPVNAHKPRGLQGLQKRRLGVGNQESRPRVYMFLTSLTATIHTEEAPKEEPDRLQQHTANIFSAKLCGTC